MSESVKEGPNPNGTTVTPITEFGQMTKYKSHKTVYAEKIKSITLEKDIPEDASTRPEVGGAEIVFENNTFVNVEPGYLKKHNPQVDGYLVIYEGGYVSWSPADVFEKGNTKVEPEKAETFADRLLAEAKSLAEKIGKLELALKDGVVPEVEVPILKIQLSVMVSYYEILQTRLDKMS